MDDDSDDEDSKDSDDNEEPIPAQVNSNYNKANEELLLFESFKRKKNRPMFDRPKSSILVDVDDDENTHEIIVGPVLSRGKNISLQVETLQTTLTAVEELTWCIFFDDHIARYSVSNET